MFDLPGIIGMPDSGQVRPPGWHVSNLIRVISEKLGDISAEPLIQANLMMSVGIAWENYILGIYARHVGVPFIRSLLLQKDDIWGTPDGYNTESNAIIEVKCTWMSSKRSVVDIWRYMCQVKAYCYMIGTDRADMLVLYICGNYRPPFPALICYHLEFGDRELVENWGLLVNCRDSLALKEDIPHD